MEKRKDYYMILGVARDASTAAIKRAYSRLMKQLGRDAQTPVSPDFQALKAAYETLADAERRRRYDEALSAPFVDRFSKLSWSFVDGPAAGDLRRPIEPGSLSGEILLTRSEADAGGTVPLDVPVNSPCPQCDGTGGESFDCSRCGGDGAVVRRFPVAVHLPRRVREGTVFQVLVDEPSVQTLLLTVHVRPM